MAALHPTSSQDQAVVVVGGGPAGLMAAERLASVGVRVTVYDRMPSVGRKFLMAGRGGLNLTHGEPPERFSSRYGAATGRLRPVLARFPPERLRAWAAGLGQDTWVGSSGRVFPACWKASPLLRAWLERLDGLGVRFALRHLWTGVTPDGELRFRTPDGFLTIPRPAATVLALGGASWPRLGSDGAWLAGLAGLGIRSAPLRPANCGVLLPWSEPFRGRFAGEPLKRVAMEAGGERRLGEAVVTRSGLEGGLVYGLVPRLREALAAGGPVALAVDLRPDLPLARLAERLSRPRGRRSVSTFLRKEAGLAPVAVALLRESCPGGLSDGAETLAGLVKAVPLRVTGTAGLERAISSAGGVLFEEVDERLMLTAWPGAFVAGEMLDWEAPTGGYLLQACFATGVAAAEGALRWLGRSEARNPASA